LPFGVLATCVVEISEHTAGQQHPGSIGSTNGFAWIRPEVNVLSRGIFFGKRIELAGQFGGRDPETLATWQ
jgi:hypothetical protein